MWIEQGSRQLLITKCAHTYCFTSQGKRMKCEYTKQRSRIRYPHEKLQSLHFICSEFWQYHVGKELLRGQRLPTGAMPARERGKPGLTLQAAVQPHFALSSATAVSYASSAAIIAWIIPPCVLAG